MLRPNSRYLTTLITLGVAGAIVYAQQKPPAKPPAADDTGTVFKVDTRLVVCNATVVDKTGHLVTDLPKSAFTVLENGQPQEKIRFSSTRTFRSRWGW